MDISVRNLKLVILFGSRARGTAGKMSDFDVAALADQPLDLDDRGKVAEAIGRHFGVSEDIVDVADLWDAPPLLQHEAGESGKLFYGSEFDFLRFRVLAWKRYQDTAKFRRIRERALKEQYG